MATTGLICAKARKSAEKGKGSTENKESGQRGLRFFPESANGARNEMTELGFCD
jgi:hypothetical protein